MHFPNETPAYRRARNRLLKAESDLRGAIEKVAAARRKLPKGGKLREDYEFDSASGGVRLSQLFERGDTLVAYSFMFGPKMANACPMCTSFLDGLDGNAHHIAQRANLVVIAKSPIERILSYARDRGWRNLRLLSSARNTYNRDYHGEDERGAQWPMLNVFTKNGGVRHFWGSELLGAKPARGQNPRHNDLMWPLWNVLDLTPEGRGSDWYPKRQY